MTEKARLSEAERDKLDWRDTPSSSNVKRIAFDPGRIDDDGVQRGQLFVDFGGTLYRYTDVTVDEARGLLQADSDERLSVGRTLNQTVKRLRECARVEIKDDDEEREDAA